MATRLRSTPASACYFLPQLFVLRTPLTDAQKLRFYDQYFEATRAAHAGQALDLAGCADAMADAVESGDGERIERHVRAVHHLKSAVPAGCLARIGAVLGGGSEEQIGALGQFVEGVGLAFQIVDDVLNLRGFEGDSKLHGEDIAAGKITLPIAAGIGRLERGDRQWLWETLSSRPGDPVVIAEAIALLESCGAIDACQRQAEQLVEDGWARLSPVVPDSQSKLMLRAFSWFVLERHY